MVKRLRYAEETILQLAKMSRINLIETHSIPLSAIATK